MNQKEDPHHPGRYVQDHEQVCRDLCEFRTLQEVNASGFGKMYTRFELDTICPREKIKLSENTNKFINKIFNLVLNINKSSSFIKSMLPNEQQLQYDDMIAHISPEDADNIGQAKILVPDEACPIFRGKFADVVNILALVLLVCFRHSDVMGGLCEDISDDVKGSCYDLLYNAVFDYSCNMGELNRTYQMLDGKCDLNGTTEMTTDDETYAIIDMSLGFIINQLNNSNLMELREYALLNSDKVNKCLASAGSGVSPADSYIIDDDLIFTLVLFKKMMLLDISVLHKLTTIKLDGGVLTAIDEIFRLVQSGGTTIHKHKYFKYIEKNKKIEKLIREKSR